MEKEMIEKVAKLESSVEEYGRRLENLEGKVEDIRELTYSVKEIASETKMLREDYNKLNTRVDDIEKEPAEEYKDLKKSVIKQVITAIVGLILGAIGGLLLK